MLSFLWTLLGRLSDMSQAWACILQAVEEQTHFSDLVNMELVCPDATPRSFLVEMADLAVTRVSTG